jgi:hypothetical protein
MVEVRQVQIQLDGGAHTLHLPQDPPRELTGSAPILIAR